MKPCKTRASVISGNTECFIFEYCDENRAPVDPSAISLTFSDTYTGKVFFSEDVTSTIQREYTRRYKYYYVIPSDCDNLQIETKATIDGQVFLDRIVVKVADARAGKYPDGTPR